MAIRFPTADDYAYSLEQVPTKPYFRQAPPIALLTRLNRGKVLRKKEARYLHWANGAFAFVYRFQTGRDIFALRCLTTSPPSDTVARYRALQTFTRNRRTPFLVRCQHIEEALWVSIGSQGGYYPVQVMDWVEGPTLLEKVAALVRAGDRLGLGLLALQWQEMIQWLARTGIIHGDLHPDNVLVTPKQELRLVDYDTVVVPGFITNTPPNGGMEGYVHPCYSRGQQTRRNAALLDDFGALIVLLSLRALAFDPALRATSQYLLLDRTDLEQPDASALFDRLENCGEPSVASLARLLRKECHRSDESGDATVTTLFPPPPPDPSVIAPAPVAKKPSRKSVSGSATAAPAPASPTPTASAPPSPAPAPAAPVASSAPAPAPAPVTPQPVTPPPCPPPQDKQTGRRQILETVPLDEDRSSVRRPGRQSLSPESSLLSPPSGNHEKRQG